MLSERIKNERVKKGLTQVELSKVIGVTQQAVGKWERGKAMPDHEILLKLADFFNISVDYLLGRNDTVSILSDIKEKTPKELQKILEQHEIIFNGTTLTEEDKQAILDLVELQLYKRAKELTKRKKATPDL